MKLVLRKTEVSFVCRCQLVWFFASNAVCDSWPQKEFLDTFLLTSLKNVLHNICYLLHLLLDLIFFSAQWKKWPQLTDWDWPFYSISTGITLLQFFYNSSISTLSKVSPCQILTMSPWKCKKRTRYPSQWKTKSTTTKYQYLCSIVE